LGSVVTPKCFIGREGARILAPLPRYFRRCEIHFSQRDRNQGTGYDQVDHLKDHLSWRKRPLFRRHFANPRGLIKNKGVEPMRIALSPRLRRTGFENNDRCEKKPRRRARGY
jgi:hypothetical protein